jgi:hypothetical protein
MDYTKQILEQLQSKRKTPISYDFVFHVDWRVLGVGENICGTGNLLEWYKIFTTNPQRADE